MTSDSDEHGLSIPPVRDSRSHNLIKEAPLTTLNDSDSHSSDVGHAADLAAQALQAYPPPVIHEHPVQPFRPSTEHALPSHSAIASQLHLLKKSTSLAEPSSTSRSIADGGFDDASAALSPREQTSLSSAGTESLQSRPGPRSSKETSSIANESVLRRSTRGILNNPSPSRHPHEVQRSTFKVHIFRFKTPPRRQNRPPEYKWHSRRVRDFDFPAPKDMTREEVVRVATAVYVSAYGEHHRDRGKMKGWVFVPRLHADDGDH